MLLAYLTWRCDLQGRIAVQMEKRGGIVLEVNATCSAFEGTVCSQLLGAHASTTHCNTVSYTVGKGETSMLKTLKEWAFRGYQAGWGRRVLLRQSEAVELFIAALYEQHSSSSMAQAHYNKIMYTRKQIRINMSLPPTDLIIYPHLKRDHFQMLLCKAAHQLGSLGVSISQNMAGRSKME